MPNTKSIFVSASDDIKLWDPESMQIIKQYNYHEANVKDVAWNHDNSILASTCLNGDSILLSDPCLKYNNKPKVVRTLADNEQQTSVCFGPSEKFLISGGTRGDVNAWHCFTGKLHKTFNASHPSPVTCMDLNSSETLLASACTTGEIRLWMPGSGTALSTLRGAKGQAIRGIEFSAWVEFQFGTTSDDGALCIWDGNKQTIQRTISDAHHAPAMDLSYSTLNHLLLGSCGLDKNVVLYDMSQKKPVKTVCADHPLTSICFMADGMHICAGSSLGNLFKFDLRKTTGPVCNIQAHSTSVQKLVLQTLEKKIPQQRSTSTTEYNRDGSSSRKHRGGQLASNTLSPENKAEKLTSPKIEKYNHAKSNGRSDIENVRKKSDSKSSKQTAPTEESPGMLSQTKKAISAQSKDNKNPDVTIQFEHGPDALSKVDAMGNTPGLKSNHSSFRDTLGSYCEGIFSPVASEFRGETPNIFPQENGKSFIFSTNNAEGPKVTKKGHSGADKLENGHPELHQKSNIPLAHSSDPGNSKNVQQNKMNDVQGKLGNSMKYSCSPKVLFQTKKVHPPSPLATNSYDGFPNEFTAPHKTASLSSRSDSESAQESPPQATFSNILKHSPTPSRRSDKDEVLPEEGAARGASHSSEAFQYQMDFLKNTVRHLVEEHEDNVRDQIMHLHMQVIKMVMQLETKIENLAERCSVNPLLLQEIERLRLENDRLRRKY